MSVPISQVFPLSPFFHSIHIFLLYTYVYISALQIRSILFFWIPHICVNIWNLFFSVWLTLLCIIISRPVHVSKKWPSFIPVSGWVVFHCIYVPCPLYPFLWWWTHCLQPFARLDVSYPDYGGPSALLHLLIQMLISSRNTFPATPRITFNQRSGHPMAQSGGHINLHTLVSDTCVGYFNPLLHHQTTQLETLCGNPVLGLFLKEFFIDIQMAQVYSLTLPKE